MGCDDLLQKKPKATRSSALPGPAGSVTGPPRLWRRCSREDAHGMAVVVKPMGSHFGLGELFFSGDWDVH